MEAGSGLEEGWKCKADLNDDWERERERERERGQKTNRLINKNYFLFHE